MTHRRSLLLPALLSVLASSSACKEQAKSNPLPTIRLGSLSAGTAATGASTPALVDRDTTTTVAIGQPTVITLSTPHAVEIRRVKVYGAGVRVSVDGAPDLVRDGTAGAWGTLDLSSPLTSSQLSVTVTPIAGGATVGEIELWGAGLPQALHDVQALAEATKSQEAAFEDAVVLRAIPSSLTLQPGSAGPNCLEATLPASNPRGARRAYLVYESTARRAVVLSRSVDAQAASGGFWLPPASQAGTLVDEIDPERLNGTSDTVSLCLPDDATDAIAVSGVRLVLVLDNGTDLFTRETHEQWTKVVDGDGVTNLAVDAGRMELGLDRPIAVDGASIQLGATPAHLSSVGAFDGATWADLAGLDLTQSTSQLPLVGLSPQAAQLTFGGTARTGIPVAVVSEVQLSGSGVGPRVGAPRIVLTYPALQFQQGIEVGERFGDHAYVAGWAESPSGAGTIEIGGAPVGVNGAFGIALDRPATATDGWTVTVMARFPDGSTATRAVHLDDDHEAEILGGGSGSGLASQDLRFGSENQTSWGSADPTKGGRITLGTDVSIDIPPGALASKTSIGITRKGPEELPPLDAGMVNVTAPPHGAYRFLPKGQKFATAVKLKIPYDLSLLPEGMAPEAIQTFYYDESLEEWKALPRTDVLRSTSQIVSETTHFTLMINAVLVTPDHPGPTSFNPNSIKDLKAADPSQGIDLVEAPQGNSQGTAQLVLPIRLPKARGAFQPELKLAYDSGAADGWVGVGWDLSVSSVQIDTKFGAPEYTGNERYLLDGVRLVPTADSSACQDRTSGAVYRARVERDFRRVVRCGAGPTSYWFEVSDKNGVLHVYGYGQNARLTSYDPSAPYIGQWNLERVIDTNGNLTQYFYDVDDRSQTTIAAAGQPLVVHHEDFRQRYLSQIRYAGTASREGAGALAGGTSGPYHVQLYSEQDVSGPLLERPDTLTSGRLGFKVVTRRRLHSIQVGVSSDAIREYQLTYERGSFGKSRMTRVDVFGAGDAPQLFYTHTFAYTDADRYQQFDPPVAWTFSEGGDDKSITRSEETGWGIHTYGGISTFAYKQGGAVGARVGISGHNSKTKSLLIDIDGDGLPDRVIDRGDGTYDVRFNMGGPLRTLTKALPVHDPWAGQVPGVPLPTLGSENGGAWNVAFQASASGGGVSGNVNAGYSHFASTTTEFLTDADGDGLIDAVLPNGIWFQQPRKPADPTTFRFSQSVAVTDPSSQSQDQDFQDSLRNNLQPSDALVEWIAPYDGVVDVVGTLAFPGRSPVDPSWDGVRLRVYQVLDSGSGSPSTTQLGSDVDLKIALTATQAPVHLTGQPVSRGTRLYFLLSTLADFPVDPTGPSPIEDASFAPTITYTALGDCTTAGCQQLTSYEQGWADPTGAAVFSFDAQYDFKLGGAPLGALVIPASGELAITATLRKLASSDDVRACIQKFPMDATAFDVPCAGSGFARLGPGTLSYGPGETGTFDWSNTAQVGAAEKLVFRLESDLPIDPASVAWEVQGQMTQLCDQLGNCRPTTTEEASALSFVAEPYLELHLPLDPAATLAGAQTLIPSPSPLVPFVAPGDGVITIDTSPPDPAFVQRPPGSSGWPPIWLTARNASGYLFKQRVDAPGRIVTVSVTSGELIYFEAHSELPFALAWAPTISFNGLGQYVGGLDFPVNSTFDHLKSDKGLVGIHSVFGGGFHGWRYGAWHGANDKPFDASAFEVSSSVIDDATKSQTAPDASKIVEPLVPRRHGTWFSAARTGLKPLTHAYISKDGATFITATTMHGSREGGFVQQQDGKATTVAALFQVGGTSRHGEGHTLTGGVGVGSSFGGLGIQVSSGSSRQTSDLLDMNGDRVVDAVGSGAIKITDIHDLHAKSLGLSSDVLRSSQDFAINLSSTISSPNVEISDGGVVQGMHGTFGLGGGINLSSTDYELVDVNGDGLPDRVSRGTNPNCSGFTVRLNLGGHFAASEDCVPVHDWNIPGTLDFDGGVYGAAAGLMSPDKVRHTTAISVQGNLGFGFEPEVFEGSVAYETSVAATAVTVVDVNGDGLPDYVRKSSKDRVFYVQINTGYGFLPWQAWPVAAWPPGVTTPWLKTGVTGMDDVLNLVLANGKSVDSVEANGTYDELPTVGFAVTFSVPVFIVPWLNFTTGGDATLRRVSGFDLGFIDMDGDGLADHVLKAQAGSGDNQKIWVRLNREGKANLLKHVGRPLGGSIELDYARTGNTYDLPESRWVMSQVIVRDGRGGSGAVDVVDGHDLQSNYVYSLGKHDRTERDFLGFGSVVRTDVDHAGVTQRQIAQTWHNESFAVKGLLDREELWGGTGRLFSATQNSYNTYTMTQGYTSACDSTTPFFLSSDSYCQSFFTRLEREEKRFYEGQGASGTVPAQPGLTTAQTFLYDQYGNVVDFWDLGDASSANAVTADDLHAAITYETGPDALRLYFVGKPFTVDVTDAGGRLLRKRKGDYDGLGNLTTLTSWVENAKSVDVKLVWKPDGNLQEFQGPDVKGRHTFDYGYDAATNTYVTQIEDKSLGYTSTAEYDPKFGEPTRTADENGNVIQRAYDSFGRLQTLAGPGDSLSSPTVSVTYGLDATIPYARTRNKHPERGTVDTVVLVDGLRRAIQTKKTAEVEGSGIGWSVSGQQIFDALGRVAQRGQTFFELGSNALFNPGTPLNPTYLAYDVLGRTVQTQEPNADAPNALATTTVAYDFGIPAGSPIVRLRSTVVDPLGNRKVLYRDPRDEVVAVQENTGTSTPTTSYLYDPVGQLQTVTDAQGNQTALTYDLLGRRTTLDNPDAGLTTFVYDAAGNLIQKQDANLNQKKAWVTYDYVFDQLRTINYPFSAAVTYEYGTTADTAENQVGRVKRIVDDAGQETRGYGKLGETTRSTRTVRPLKPNGTPQTFEMGFAFDSFGRMKSMVYPDGERLAYHYDAGGLVAGATGTRPATKHYQAQTETYLTSLTYDEFEQRKTLVYGNGGTSVYTYDPLTRRLKNLDTTVAGRRLQRLTYAYDLVGNVTGLTNALGQPTTGYATGPQSGAVSYSYGYDRLYRLTAASGRAYARPGVVDSFASSFRYDDIHNMTANVQVHTISSLSSQGTGAGEAKPTQSNHDWGYGYDPAHPHRALQIGDTLLAYDSNGNTTRECRDHGDPTCQVDHDHLRELSWNEENRLTSVVEGGGRHVTSFLYDAAGQRVVKQGRGGDSITIGQFFNLKGKIAATKHVFVGETRLASKLLPPPGWDQGLVPVSTSGSTAGTTTPLPGCDPSTYSPNKCPLPGAPPVAYGVDTTTVRPETYYYHADHLGSTSWVTDQNGKVHEHVEYYPYGEVWWEPKYDRDGAGVKGQQFLFTSKELDEETGLYYFGARYYDPRKVRWESTDPILALPGGKLRVRDSALEALRAREPSSETSSTWASSLNLYQYAHNSPLRYTDPDGRDAKVHVNGNQVRIEIPIVYSGNAANPQTMAAMNSAIAQQWTGTFGKYQVTTTVTQGNDGPSTNRIELTQGAGVSRVSAPGGNAGKWFVPGQGSATWEAAHEAGHLMGLGDRYTATLVNGVRTTTALPGFSSNVMGAYGQTGVREQDVSDVINANKWYVGWMKQMGRSTGMWPVGP